MLDVERAQEAEEEAEEEHRADISSLKGAVLTQDTEEMLVDAESTVPAPKSQKGKGVKAPPQKTTKPAAPAKATAAKPTPRTSRVKTPAQKTPPKTGSTGASTPDDAALARSKFGFKAPTGRKRKPVDMENAPAGAGTAKRQTRQASAAQEELERKAEAESNAAKRTRGARKK